MGADDALDAARVLAEAICLEAIWCRDRCTWVGSTTEQQSDTTWQQVDMSLDGSLYSGTAGVAVALSEAAAVVDLPEARRVARGAIRHTMTRLTRGDGTASGLFDGAAAIRLAVRWVGGLLADDELISWRPPRHAEEPASREFDLVGGRAGSILARLATGDPVGEGQLSTARRSQRPSPRSSLVTD